MQKAYISRQSKRLCYTTLLASVCFCLSFSFSGLWFYYHIAVMKSTNHLDSNGKEPYLTALMSPNNYISRLCHHITFVKNAGQFEV